MGLYTDYETNVDVEKSGVVFELSDDTRIRMARAGGANKQYLKKLEQVTRPHRRAIATESISTELSNKLMRETFAETIILDWQTLVDGEWVQGIVDKEGDIQPFNAANVIKTFEDLPEVFDTLQTEAAKIVHFRSEQMEEESGN